MTKLMITHSTTGMMVLAAVACISTFGCGRSSNSDSQPASSASLSADSKQSLVSDQDKGSPPPALVPASDELTDALFDDGRATALKGSPEGERLPGSERSLSLRADLDAARLAEFLKLADLEMQRIANQVNSRGISQAKGDQEMVRLGKLKLQAATQLQTAEDADTTQRALGIRGQLQSLSHLAALGDLKSAEALEALARERVDHEDLTVAEDSRLVLIGFALERIQNGSDKNPAEIMAQVARVGEDGRVPNIAAMMVLGQSRAVLEKYGFTDEAARVRDRIVELFASHPDPNVASMAWQIAGTPRFAEVDQMLQSLGAGDELTAETWRTTLSNLLGDSPDLATVQFIAGAALHAEAAGRDDLAAATYDLLQSTASLGERERQEVQVASAARQARQGIIGQDVGFDLPSADGRPLTMSSHLGKVVLMPFWAINYPDSLSLLQRLDEIRAQFPGQVEIVGVNLDAADAPLEEFMAQSPVRFRSFHSETKPGAEVANPVAAKFGVVSMPYIVIVGRDGKVADIDFTGQRLQESIERLLTTPAP